MKRPDDETLVDALLTHAASMPNRPALLLEPGRTPLSWSQLAERVRTVAAELTSQLTSERAIVGHLVSNRPEDVVLSLAIQFAGFVEAPIDQDGGDSYVQSCWDTITRSDWNPLWIDATQKQQLVAAPVSRSASQRSPRTLAAADALVLWTSGTSGAPKGVVLSHECLLSNAAAKLKAVPQAVDDIRLTLLSIAHAYARTSDLGTWILSGCTLAIAAGFDGWCEFAPTVNPTLCNTVPSLSQRILLEEQIGNLRLLGCGGAAMSSHEFDQWQQRGVTVIQGYGLTEAGPVICSQSPEESIAGHVGRFVDGWQHRLRGDRLYVRGPGVMSRYWEAPEATKARIDPDGWLDTGDVVEIDPDHGQLRVLGRSDDLIVLSNGFNVHPQPIEQQYGAVPGVQRAVVVANANGRAIDLWIESDSESLPLDAVSEQLARWQRPAQIRRFAIPPERRSELLTRKGAIRRDAFCSWVSG